MRNWQGIPTTRLTLGGEIMAPRDNRTLVFSTELLNYIIPCARCKFWGVVGSEDFAHATLPTTTPLIFKAKFKIFVTLLKIRFKIAVTLAPPPPLPSQKEQSQNYNASINSNGLFTLSELLSLKFLLHMTTSFIKENHFNNCI